MWSGLGNSTVCYMVMNVLEEHSGPVIYMCVCVCVIILHYILN